MKVIMAKTAQPILYYTISYRNMKPYNKIAKWKQYRGAAAKNKSDSWNMHRDEWEKFTQVNGLKKGVVNLGHWAIVSVQRVRLGPDVHWLQDQSLVDVRMVVKYFGVAPIHWVVMAPGVFCQCWVGTIAWLNNPLNSDNGSIMHCSRYKIIN